MGSQYVDGSPSWDSIGSSLVSGFMAAPQKALSATSTADQILINRAEELRKRKEFEAATAAGAAGAAALPSDPIATGTRVVPGPWNPDDPATQMPGPDIAVMPAQSQPVLTAADVARAQKDRLFFGNTIKAGAYKNPASLPELYAKGSVGVSGVPKTPDEIARLEFLTTGKTDKTKPDNYVAVDPNTGNTLKILGPGDGTYTADGQTKLTNLAPPGSVIMKAGETQLNAKPRTMMDDSASRQNALLDATIQIGRGQLPSTEQTTRLEYALRTEYPAIEKIMSNAIGDSTILHDFVEKLPPGPLKPLMEHIARTNYPLAVPAAPAPGSVFATGTAPVTPSGGLVGTAASTAAAPAAAPILPGYDSKAPIATTTLTERPATEAQIKHAQALATVSNERATIEKLIGVQKGPDGKPMVPPGAYVPSWAASMIYDKTGSAGISGKILNAMDPNARNYFIAARAWVEPVLRIASGAVTPPEEVVGYMQRFIPDANDSDALKAVKLTRMRVWEGAARKATTAGNFVDMVMKDPETDPEARAMAESFRVRAAEAGTLNTPVEHVSTTPSQGAGGGNSAVTTASPRASTAPPAAADRVVGQTYPTPKGPMKWTGPETGWQP